MTMRTLDWTTTEVVRQACTFQRHRLGEPLPMTPGAFDRWLAAERAAGVAEGIRQAREAVERRIRLSEDGFASPAGILKALDAL